MESMLHIALALILAPLLPGIVNRTKAFFAGRTGRPVWQLYADLWKLLQKGAVYSRTTTWVFKAGPMLGLTAVVLALTLTPFGAAPSLLGFPGDVIMFAYLLGLMRFFTVLAALDTGSSFEGMGGAREVFFAALAEPAFLLGLIALVYKTSSLQLSEILQSVSGPMWLTAGPALALIAVSWLVVFLAENSRIPVDDPNTHLELTMIHEVMILDHSGPDLAWIEYGAALKLWVMGALLVTLVVPARAGAGWLNDLAFLGGLGALAVIVGVIESSMARLRLNRVPQLLVGATALAVLAVILVIR